MYTNTTTWWLAAHALYVRPVGWWHINSWQCYRECIHFVQTFRAAWSQVWSQTFSNWACQNNSLEVRTDGHTLPPSRHLKALPPTARLTEWHFPEKVPPCPSGRPSQPVCIVCSNKKGRGKKTTTYQCKDCKLSMCIVPCFELYHTKVDPVRYLEQV